MRTASKKSLLIALLVAIESAGCGSAAVEAAEADVTSTEPVAVQVSGSARTIGLDESGVATVAVEAEREATSSGKAYRAVRRVTTEELHFVITEPAGMNRQFGVAGDATRQESFGMRVSFRSLPDGEWKDVSAGATDRYWQSFSFSPASRKLRGTVVRAGYVVTSSEQFDASFDLPATGDVEVRILPLVLSSTAPSVVGSHSVPFGYTRF
ncbi:MAG: hypothetical protein HOO96_03635 [Polyangiaceae bacterium]|nr:hypothetical protein [Polyangiaceae bacterium]